VIDEAVPCWRHDGGRRARPARKLPPGFAGRPVTGWLRDGGTGRVRDGSVRARGAKTPPPHPPRRPIRRTEMAGRKAVTGEGRREIHIVPAGGGRASRGAAPAGPRAGLACVSTATRSKGRRLGHYFENTVSPKAAKAQRIKSTRYCSLASLRLARHFEPRSSQRPRKGAKE